MKKLDLFKAKKRLCLVIALLCFLIVISAFYFDSSSDIQITSVMGLSSSIFIFLFHFYQFNQYFFIFEKDAVRWKWLYMKQESKIELTGDITNISKDWKGIYFTNNSQDYSIMTDGLTSSQKQMIVDNLKHYPFLIS